jgi:hypothetical protein
VAGSRNQRKSRDEIIAMVTTVTQLVEAELGPWADSKLQLSLNALNFSPWA